MFCTSCGAQVDEGQAFCTQCGAPVRTAPQQVIADTVEPVAASQSVNQPEQAPMQAQTPRKKLPRGGIAAIALAAVAVCVVAAVGVGIFVTSGKAPEAAIPDNTAICVFNVSADGEEELEDGTAIPLEVEGTTDAGEQIHTSFVYRVGEGPFSLPGGGYRIRILSSPISKSGAIYDYPKQTYTVTVTGGNTIKNPQPITGGEEPKLTKRTDATEQQKKEAQQAIEKAEKENKEKKVVNTAPAATPKPEPEPAPSDGAPEQEGGATDPSKNEDKQDQGADSSQSGKDQDGKTPSGTPLGKQDDENGSAGDRTESEKESGDLDKKEAEAAKKAAEEQAEKEYEEALAANQEEYESTNDGSEGPKARITGVLRRYERTDKITEDRVTIYTLEVPEEVSVVGTQYGEVSDNEVIVSLGDKYDEYVDKRITLEGSFSVRATASIPEAEFSAMYCNNNTLVRDYEVKGYTVSSDRKGGIYRVVTGYYEFEVPEYWRDKIEIEFDTLPSEYDHVPSACLLGIRIRCIAGGLDADDSNSMYYVSVVPISEYAARSYTGKDMIASTCEAATDAYAVVFAQEDYFMHYVDADDPFVSTITGGKMKSASSEHGSSASEMLAATNGYFAESIAGSLKVKDAADASVAPECIFPAKELSDEANGPDDEPSQNDEADEEEPESESANPDSIVYDQDDGEVVSLTGVIEREELTTEDTMMAWSCVVYWLVLEEPVHFEFTTDMGTFEGDVDKISVFQEEQYNIDGESDVNAGLGDVRDDYWDSLAGETVTVSGELRNTGNAHTLNGVCMFVDPEVE